MGRKTSLGEETGVFFVFSRWVSLRELPRVLTEDEDDELARLAMFKEGSPLDETCDTLSERRFLADKGAVWCFLSLEACWKEEGMDCEEEREPELEGEGPVAGIVLGKPFLATFLAFLSACILCSFSGKQGCGRRRNGAGCGTVCFSQRGGRVWR